MSGHYVYITEETVKSARERAEKELSELTGGKTMTAIALAKEIEELDSIVAEIEKKQEV